MSAAESPRSFNTSSVCSEGSVAIKLSDTPGTIRSAAPLPSEHTEDVLKDLGLSAADIGRLRDTGVIE